MGLILARRAGILRHEVTMDIFVVDDEYVIAETLAIILRRHGYQALAFRGAAPALIARSLRPRLLVTDHDMPGMDGAALIREFLGGEPNFPSILFSGNDRLCSQSVFGDLQHPRRKLLFKPLHPAALLTEINCLIGAPER